MGGRLASTNHNTDNLAWPPISTLIGTYCGIDWLGMERWRWIASGLRSILRKLHENLAWVRSLLNWKISKIDFYCDAFGLARVIANRPQYYVEVNEGSDVPPFANDSPIVCQVGSDSSHGYTQSQIRSSRYGLCILAIVVINAEEHNDHVSDNAQN